MTYKKHENHNYSKGVELDPTNKHVSQLLTYLTDTIPVKEDDESLKLVKREELRDVISKKLDGRDYIAVKEILELADKSLKPESLIKYVSKSVRVPTPVYAKLSEIAHKSEVVHKKEMPISHVLGILSVRRMKEVLSEITDTYEVVDERKRKIEGLIESWGEKMGSRLSGMKENKG